MVAYLVRWNELWLHQHLLSKCLLLFCWLYFLWLVFFISSLGTLEFSSWAYALGCTRWKWSLKFAIVLNDPSLFLLHSEHFAITPLFSEQLTNSKCFFVNRGCTLTYLGTLAWLSFIVKFSRDDNRFGWIWLCGIGFWTISEMLTVSTCSFYLSDNDPILSYVISLFCDTVSMEILFSFSFPRFSTML